MLRSIETSSHDVDGEDHLTRVNLASAAAGTLADPNTPPPHHHDTHRNAAMNDILFDLNDQQRAAVTCPSNVLQVLAPPGSGKTKTLTARVAYHIAHENLKPWNIIVCTFTIKAAREMKDRIRNFVGEKLESKLVLGTFHSVARRYLSTYGHHVSVPKHFGIADTSDTLAIIKRIVKKGKYSMEPGKAKSRISKEKSGVASPKPARARPDVEQQEFEAIFAAYQQELKEAKLLDYDDLLLRCVELLEDHPECASNIEAVLIDEFQDTNHVQYRLMNLFARHGTANTYGQAPKLTIVGDPDQSIYSFRSAEIENLKRMQKKYSCTQVIHLEENYRSSGAILQFATEVIEQDTSRPQKNLQATHSIGQAPVLRTLVSASVEAAWVVSEIRRSLHLNAGLLTYADYAILLRSAALSRLIETELGRAGIPYRMVGGHKFFDRVEVRILLDYLRVISQPDHNDALLRIINVPSRKLGDTTMQALFRERDARGKTLWSLIKAIAQGNLKPADKISQQAMTGLESFTNVILAARQKLSQPDTTISGLLSFVMQKLKYETFLRETYKQEYDDRAANVDELVTLAENGRVFAEQEEELIAIEGIEQQKSDIQGPAEELAQFLAKISLATDADKQDAEDGSNDKVVISTIHAAKGLEWPVVFIPAAYQGSIPHSRAEDVDEERRLLYVGMTRAKALLYLSWPKTSSKTEHTVLSPFLTTPTISRYYECKGPSFGWQVSTELARILARDCPASSVIERRYLELGTEAAPGIRAEDDRHSEDIEEVVQESKLYSHDYTADDLDRHYGGGYKKRKYNDGSFSIQSNVVSAAPSAGFVTAKLQMQEIEAKMASSERAKHERKSTKLIVDSQNRSKSQPQAKKVAVGQSSMMSFLTRTQSIPNESAATTVDLERASSSKSLPPSASVFRQQSSFASLKTNTSVLWGASRSVSSRTSFQKPRIALEEASDERPTHVLLSSSPTKPETAIDFSQIDARHQEDDAGGKENTYTADEGLLEKAQGFQRASTMHTTSMQKLKGLQSRPGARTKIVGRSTGGYVNTQYRPPTIK